MGDVNRPYFFMFANKNDNSALPRKIGSKDGELSFF